MSRCFWKSLQFPFSKGEKYKYVSSSVGFGAIWDGAQILNRWIENQLLPSRLSLEYTQAVDNGRITSVIYYETEYGSSLERDISCENTASNGVPEYARVTNPGEGRRSGLVPSPFCGKNCPGRYPGDRESAESMAQAAVAAAFRWCLRRMRDPRMDRRCSGSPRLPPLCAGAKMPPVILLCSSISSGSMPVCAPSGSSVKAGRCSRV